MGAHRITATPNKIFFRVVTGRTWCTQALDHGPCAASRKSTGLIPSIAPKHNSRFAFLCEGESRRLHCGFLVGGYGLSKLKALDRGPGLGEARTGRAWLSW